MNDSFDQDAPERTSSGAGVKALRARLEQQNVEASGIAVSGKHVSLQAQSTNGRQENGSQLSNGARSTMGSAVSKSHPAMRLSGGPPASTSVYDIAQEVEKWKKEAEQHKHAAHQLAKLAKTSKEEALEARKKLEDERDHAQKSRAEADEVIDSLHKQMHQLVNSPSKVVSSSAEVSSLIAQLNDANYKHRDLMQEIIYKEDEIAEIRRNAAQMVANEKEACMQEIQKLQDVIEEERAISRQQSSAIEQKLNQDEGSVAVLMEALNNRDRHISDLERQVANAKILATTKPEPIDVQQMRSLENELWQTQTLLDVRSAEVDKMREEMENLKSDINHLLEEREHLRSAETNLRRQLEDAVNVDGNNGQITSHEQEKNIRDLLMLQEELVHELDMMKRDMATLAMHNKSLEFEKERLLVELAEYACGGSSDASIIAPLQKKRAQRSAAPGSETEGAAKAPGNQSWENIVQTPAHVSALGQGLISPWEAMNQEVSMRKMLETENEALKIALSQAQAGRNVPVTHTSEHIHAVSLGLLSPWEGMVQAQAQVQGLEYEMKELQSKLRKGHDGTNASSLQNLEDANWKLQAKVKELTGLLDDSRKEKVELNRNLKTAQRLVAPPISTTPPKLDESQKEELERLQRVCEQQSKWILESSRSNRDRLLLVELQAHVMNIESEDKGICDLRKLVEAQKTDAAEEGTTLSTRDLPKIRAMNQSDVESISSSMDGKVTYFSSRLFSSSQSQREDDMRSAELYSSQGSLADSQSVRSQGNGETVAIGAAQQRRMQRSAAPGALRTPPNAMRASGDGDTRSMDGDFGGSNDTSNRLRDSAIDEMLASFPDNRDIWASGTSASSRYSSADPAGYHVPDIADDILNYRPPSTSEMRKTKLAAANAKRSPTIKASAFEMPAISPSEYIRRSQTSSASPTLSASRVAVNTSHTTSTRMTPSEYLASRGIPHTATQSVRSVPAHGSLQVMQPQVYAAPTSSVPGAVDAMTPERLAKFAEYQKILEQQQSAEEWELGMSNVELTAEGHIVNVRSSQLMPVLEDEDELVKDSRQSPRIRTQHMNPMEVYPPDLGGTPTRMRTSEGPTEEV